MSETVYRKDGIGQRLLVVVSRVLLRSAYFVWLSGMLFIVLMSLLQSSVTNL